MLVRDLIAKLQSFPQHAKIEVVVDGISETANDAEWDGDVGRGFIYRKEA